MILTNPKNQAQMMASEYKKRGGSYNTSKEEGQSESQKNLDKWSQEEWQTKDGSGTAKKSDGTRKRYLPKQAWEEMGEDEKEETDRKKVEESKEGKQFVGNTPKAKSARKDASKKAGSEGDQPVEDTGDKPKPRRSARNAAKRQQEEDNEGDGKGNSDKQPSGSKGSAKQSKGSNKRAKNND